jgi:hypothetical protein
MRSQGGVNVDVIVDGKPLGLYANYDDFNEARTRDFQKSQFNLDEDHSRGLVRTYLSKEGAANWIRCKEIEARDHSGVHAWVADVTADQVLVVIKWTPPSLGGAVQLAAGQPQLSGTTYRAHQVDRNWGVNETRTFIMKRTPNTDFSFAINLGGTTDNFIIPAPVTLGLNTAGCNFGTVELARTTLYNLQPSHVSVPRSVANMQANPVDASIQQHWPFDADPHLVAGVFVGRVLVGDSVQLRFSARHKNFKSSRTTWVVTPGMPSDQACVIDRCNGATFALDGTEEPLTDVGSAELYGLLLNFGPDKGRASISFKDIALCPGSPRVHLDKRVEISFAVDRNILPEGSGDLYLVAPPVAIRLGLGRTSNPKPNTAPGLFHAMFEACDKQCQLWTAGDLYSDRAIQEIRLFEVDVTIAHPVNATK